MPTSARFAGALKLKMTPTHISNICVRLTLACLQVLFKHLPLRSLSLVVCSARQLSIFSYILVNHYGQKIHIVKYFKHLSELKTILIV